MQELNKQLAETYYTAVLMLAMAALASIVGFKNRKKISELKSYYFYPLAGLAQFIIFILREIYFPGNNLLIVIKCSVSLFLIIEVGLYYYVTFHNVKNRALRFVFYCCLIFFTIYTAILWSSTNAFYWNPQRLYPIEGITMLVPACLYFTRLFKLPASLNLFDQPTFWINIGILFTFCCILPLNFLQITIQKYFASNFYLYEINFICYSVNYFFVIRAYSCKPQENRSAMALKNSNAIPSLYEQKLY